MSMTRRLITLLTLIGAFAMGSESARAQGGVDRVHRHSGVDTGKITAVTALNVTISKSGVESTVPAEDIETVYFAGEPSELNAARTALAAGRVQEAVDALDKITIANVRRDEVLAEIEFYKAFAKSQRALAGQGSLAAATTDLRAFMAKRRGSFHIPQAVEAIGDLLAADGKYEEARTEYAKLAKAPSPYYGLRSALLVGRAWQAEGKHDEALAEFAKVLAAPQSDALFDPLKLSATLDQAVSQAAAGKGADAAATIGGIIDRADPENGELLARAFSALGDCYLKAGDKQGALFAFLHVDLLYSSSPELHAKALHELTTLWRDAGRDSRAQEAAQKLTQEYPQSRWAKAAP
jgi:tetratricopeptide (TPR) repeat protein